MTAQRTRTIRVLITALFVLGLNAATHAQTLYRVAIQQSVSVMMRDGVSLSADIFRPVSNEKFPVLLQRTPYNRTGSTGMANELASHGYIVVLQDTRGRFASGGEFYPFRNESADGFDTVEWAAKLNGSNGKVGMFGGSYVGATQMLAAMAAPPHLVSIFPYVTASEYYDGWTYQSGALMQWFSSSWTSGLAIDTLRRKADGEQSPKEWVNKLPLQEYTILKTPHSSLAPYFRDWLAHERDDSYWAQWRVSDHYSRMTVMGLHAGGWHDLFLKGSIKNYTGLRAEAATPEARAGQRLIVGPWAHAPTSAEGKIGEVVFGKAAVLDNTAATLKWFDYSLKGIKNEYSSGAPVRLFIMGSNVWRDEQEFPLARTRYTKYYLQSTKGANSISGDGSLSLAPPGDAEKKDEFDYDPQNPVPTIGGRLCCGTGFPPGPADQKPNEKRSDVLVFSTPPLTEDTEVTGFITLELYASTSAVDTDFTALLVDVDANGYARFLTDGIVRARYRESTKQASAITPGKIYKFTIDMWATANVFKAGHRIRLYVSSSNFPRFDRNMNTGEDILGATRSLKARQVIYHDREHSSALILPVIK